MIEAETEVAPYVGAWIETNLDRSISRKIFVAPYVGAWIETHDNVLIFLHLRSHPMWVRGLKLCNSAFCAIGVCRTLCGCVD